MNKGVMNVLADREQVFAAAVGAAHGLHDRLADAVYPKEVECGFEQLARLIEGLPLSVDRRQIRVLRNWTASSRGLWAEGRAAQPAIRCARSVESWNA